MLNECLEDNNESALTSKKRYSQNQPEIASQKLLLKNQEILSDLFNKHLVFKGDHLALRVFKNYVQTQSSSITIVKDLVGSKTRKSAKDVERLLRFEDQLYCYEKLLSLLEAQQQGQNLEPNAKSEVDP